MQRYDVLNHLIRKCSYASYLEIGTFDFECFDRVDCPQKTCVDPRPSARPYTYNLTSDSFFALNRDTFDLVFIDGLHTAEQVDRDIGNALRLLNEGGTMVLHDANPPTEHHARECQDEVRTPAGYAWNGTVWKALWKLRRTRDDLVLYTVDADWGCAVLRRGASSRFEVDNEFYSFQLFDQHRQEMLNLISVADFLARPD